MHSPKAHAAHLVRLQTTEPWSDSPLRLCNDRRGSRFSAAGTQALRFKIHVHASSYWTHPHYKGISRHILIRWHRNKQHMTNIF